MSRLKSIGLFSDFDLLGVSKPDFLRLTALTLLYAVFEGAGISLLLPVLKYIENGPAAFERQKRKSGARRPLVPSGKRCPIVSDTGGERSPPRWRPPVFNPRGQLVFRQ